MKNRSENQIRFSGQDTPLFDFPVENEKPVKKSAVQDWAADLGLGFLYPMIVSCVFVMGRMLLLLLGVGVWNWTIAMTQHPLPTTGIAVLVALIYIACVRYARRRAFNEVDQ